MKGKKVVVTGGAGFIGSNLVEELARENEVVVIDDLSSGSMGNLSRLLGRSMEKPVRGGDGDMNDASAVNMGDGSRLLKGDTAEAARGDKAGLGHTGQGNVTFVEGSVTDLDLLQRIFKGVDFVFHQAAMASVTRSIEDPAAAHEVNLGGTLNLLVAARDNGVSKVVFASSCAVYGNDPALPKRENMPPLPESPYAVTKLAGEYYCRVFSQVYGLPTICLRYFNVYGPRQDPHSEYAAVIPKFITTALGSQPLTIYGDGSQTRDFVYVKDVVRANILAAESSEQGVYNIGSGEQVSINMLAVAVKTMLGSEVATLYEEARAGEVKHSRADISRSTGIGYAPRYGLEAGLKETVEWFLKM